MYPQQLALDLMNDADKIVSLRDIDSINYKALEEAMHTLSEGYFANPISACNAIECWKVVEFIKNTGYLPDRYIL